MTVYLNIFNFYQFFFALISFDIKMPIKTTQNNIIRIISQKWKTRKLLIIPSRKSSTSFSFSQIIKKQLPFFRQKTKLIFDNRNFHKSKTQSKLSQNFILNKIHNQNVPFRITRNQVLIWRINFHISSQIPLLLYNRNLIGFYKPFLLIQNQLQFSKKTIISKSI